MASVQIRLLGSVEVERGGAPVQGFESRKALALLGYLALQGQAVPRSQLAELFWEGLEERRGRGNLSRVLHNLSHLLPSTLVVERNRVRLPHEPSVWVDAWAFEELRSRGSAEALAQAAALFRGELMGQLDLVDGSDFAAWLAGERERWRQRAASVLGRLVPLLVAQGRCEEASSWAERWLSFDPLAEEAHRHLMLLFARQGRRSAALAQYERCRALLAKELAVEPEEETRKVYERLRRGGARLVWSPPAVSTSFVGREEDLGEIADRLRDPACRLLTLVGPGGIGKTRLAIEAVQKLPGSFLDGVCFVPLSSLPSPALLFTALGSALGLSLKDTGDPRPLVLELLKERETLIVLDSFEHLASGVGALAEVLAAAPQVKLLVTSRVALGLPGEWVREVPGLPCPPPDAGSEAEVAGYAATRLFLESARRRTRGVSFESAFPEIARLCRGVEGMPLAIELAAAWVREMSCAEIASSVETGLDLLANPALAPGERHASVRASFEHSWRLLSEEERGLFERLALFRGGFRREISEEVADATAEGLTSLLRSSFLRWDEASCRFTMHDLLRQFGEEKLRERGGAFAAAQARFCRFFARLLAKASELEQGSDSGTLVALAEEIDNIRAAWSQAIESRDLQAVEEACEVLWAFYELRGWSREGEEAFGRAAVVLESLPEGGGALTVLRARILSRHGWFLQRLGFFSRARVCLEQAWSALPAEDPRWERELMFVETQLALVALWTGDFGTARATVEATVHRCVARGNLTAAAYCRALLGIVLFDIGAIDEAEAILRTGADACIACGDERRTATCLAYLGLLVSTRGNPTEARRLLQESLERVRRLDDQIGFCFVNDFLGLAAYASGDPAEAARYHEDSLVMASRLGFRFGEAVARAHLGHDLAALGKSDAGEEYLRTALNAALEMEARPIVLEAVSGLAHLGAPADPRAARRLLSLVLQHPAATSLTKARSRQYLAGLRSRRKPARRRSPTRSPLRGLEELVAGETLRTPLGHISRAQS